MGLKDPPSDSDRQIQHAISSERHCLLGLNVAFCLFHQVQVCFSSILMQVLRVLSSNDKYVQVPGHPFIIAASHLVSTANTLNLF